MFGLYIVFWGKAKELKRTAELNLTKGSTQGEALKIITTNHANDKSGGNDPNRMESRIDMC